MRAMFLRLLWGVLGGVGGGLEGAGGLAAGVLAIWKSGGLCESLIVQQAGGSPSVGGVPWTAVRRIAGFCAY